MIAYMVQIHGDFRRAARLLSWISHPDNLYVVMVDCATRVPKSFQEAIALLPNVHVFNDMPCNWGGASMVAETLKAISIALSLSSRWQYFINISGSDIPLKPQDEMAEILDNWKSEGKSTFITDFGHCQFNPEIVIDESIQDCREIAFRQNIKFLVYGQAKQLFERLDQSPITLPHQRSWICVSEDFHRKVLHMRPLYSVEKEARADFLAENPFRFGRQWMVIDRTMCARICESPITRRVFEFLKTVMIPDECFFQTLLNRPDLSESSILRSDNLRFKLGGPHDLHDGDLDELVDSKALFARKLNEVKGQNVIQWIWKNTGSEDLASRFE